LKNAGVMLVILACWCDSCWIV